MKAWIIFSIISVIVILNFEPRKRKVFNLEVVESDEVGFCGTESDITASFAVSGVFKANCATCHNMNLDKDGTGPALSDVSRRFPSEEYLKKFIINQESLMKAKDKFAIAISQKKPTNFIHNFKHLREEDMNELMEDLR